MTSTELPYGKGDATYQAMGGFEGIRQLVDCFYVTMDNEPQFATIANMHTESDEMKREKLLYFLCGWSGGAESYRQHFGRPISMPSAHAHLAIGIAERDMWLDCMTQAMRQQQYPDTLVTYLQQALAFPANRIVEVSEKMQAIKPSQTE